MEHSADSCEEWPADFPHFLPQLPPQFLPQLRNRIAALFHPIAVRRGPTGTVSSDTLGVPTLPHLEMWHRDFFKRKIHALIALFNHASFLRPKISNHPLIIILKNPVGCIVLESRDAVTPHRDNPAGLRNTAAFLPKSPEIQPVESLSHRHQIHAPGLQSTRFPGSQSPFDIRQEGSIPKLGGAGIHRDDFFESLRQFLGGLTAPARAVPSQTPPVALGCEPVEPFHRIARAKFRIVQGTSCKILRAHGSIIINHRGHKEHGGSLRKSGDGTTRDQGGLVFLIRRLEVRNLSIR